MIWIAFALAGLLAGILAGLLGIGGGLVTVPVMIFLLPLLGLEEGLVMHVAVATALVIIIPTAMQSARSHHRRGAVDWVLFRRLAPFLLLGGLLAALIAGQLSREWMQLIFGVFVGLVALSMLLGGLRVQGGQHARPWEQRLAALLIACWAALVGTGGGTLTVPYLYWRGVALHTAVGTSAACGLPIALAGVVGFVLLGWQQAGSVLGYVNLPVAAVMLLGAVVAAPWGAALAHRLPVGVLKRILGAVMLLVALRLLV